ncbi:MAG: Gfo/Idh/MocA family oxidoreductase [Bauldia sp.]|uniref:Gfo/Idh/MocA family protein n=1 Tax=Bauldia sp. TaxID=2575872 RepID=UPI001DF7C31B|nr:Gfo/Idh/MocA family oxidoreductase [Bauldia sp.]MCB1497868.1 Gfo/Idh/MocA family oxidoreductase [Bauldia sp.]
MSITIAKLGRRLRLGVIGGGPGSFIGPVHRAAARLDDNYEIVASVLSSNPERSKREGMAIGVAEDRAYGTAEELFAAEKAREDGIDVIAIMTPNDSHYRLSLMALENGLDIICDKPLTTNYRDARDLVTRVNAAGIVFCQTFNYSGFPMVRQAKAMVRDGDLGDVRMIEVEYVQGHNAALTPTELGEEGNWHFDPARVGESLILGDIGSHAHHLARFVSCLDLSRLTADVTAVVPGRTAHDYAGILFRLENNAPGVIWVTQAGAGAVHGLYFRLFCAQGSLEWAQETPNQLIHSRLGEPAIVFERDGPGLKPEAARATRVGIGHPEGYQEAFAVLYADAAEAIVARKLGEQPDRLALDFPTVEDGARTMQFIAAALESVHTGGWVDYQVAF